MKHLTLLLSTALLAAAAAAEENAEPEPSVLPPGPDFKTVLDLPSPGEVKIAPDGEILTRVTDRLGFVAVRGSSSRGGREALGDHHRTRV